MASIQPPACEIGRQAVDFKLLGTDGNYHSLADCAGSKGTVVMFICNHCPYVQAIATRIASDMATLAKIGVSAVAIMANDSSEYPEDSYANMQQCQREWGFAFPYLLDASQQVARAYGAVCTPDFFGYDKDLRLQYRGRLDASRRVAAAADVRRELVEAMRAVASCGSFSGEQHASIGCSIKWRS